MDSTTIAVVVIAIGSMLFAGVLAQDWGRSPTRWVWIAAVIGPLAIPVFYVVVAASAVRHKISVPRP
jgi:hypothetical protein